MINFQLPAFPDMNNFCNKHLYMNNSELYIVTALETQEQANKSA